MAPREFLEVANEWAAGNREAEWRSALSRGYYAAFHTARLLMSRCGFAVPEGERSHSYLWLRLSNCGHPDIINAGRALSDLRTDRNQADYDIDDPFHQAKAIQAVSDVEDLLRFIEDALTLPHILTQITAAMRDYESNVLKQVTWHP